MHNTHDFGRLFFHGIDLRSDAPLFHTASTVEIDEPWRVSRTVILRVPFTGKGIALGWWRDSGLEEDEALLTALQAFETSPLDDEGHLDDRYERPVESDA